MVRVRSDFFRFQNLFSFIDFGSGGFDVEPASLLTVEKKQLAECSDPLQI